MKLDKKYFETFKAEFLKWIDILGLKKYSLYFEFAKLEEDRWAEISVNELGKVAEIRINSEVPDEWKRDLNPKSSARHECFHLLLARLAALSRCRFLQEHFLEEEEEAVVVTLENLFREMDIVKKSS